VVTRRRECARSCAAGKHDADASGSIDEAEFRVMTALVLGKRCPTGPLAPSCCRAFLPRHKPGALPLVLLVDWLGALRRKR